MTMTEQILAAVAKIDNDPNAGTRRRSQTFQTRRVGAALRAIGLRRGEYSARVTSRVQGGARIYEDAIGTPRHRDGAELIERYADELAAAGFGVFLIGDHAHFIASGGGGIRTFNRAATAGSG